MQNNFNPYATMSAEQMQGLAQQQSLANIQRQQAFIESRKGDINALAGAGVKGSSAVLMPLAGLTDAWTGSNFSRQAAGMNDPAQERLAMIQKIENSIANSEGSLNKSTDNLMDAALREKLAKQQNALLAQRINAMGDKTTLKDYEHKAAQMAQRALLSEDQYNDALTRAQAEGYDPISRNATFDKSGIGKAANFLGVNDINPIQKDIDAAERAFLMSTLRDESGAAIGVQEADNQREIYFPRFGDPPEAIANKAALREAAKAGLEAKAGKAMGKLTDKLGSKAPAPKAPSGPKPGTVEGGFKFKGGDPSDPKNWEQVQ